LSSSIRSRLRSAVDAFAYSGLWTAAAAGSLAWAAGRAVAGGVATPQLGAVCLLASAGTVVVYSLDRLRDLTRDATTSPARTAFVSNHRGALIALVVSAGVVSLSAVWSLPISAWGLCGAVLTMGLLHRRLKTERLCTLAYVTASWVAIVVWLPALVAGPAVRSVPLLGTTLGIALAIAANAIASELRGMRFDAVAAIRLRRARFAALASCVLCLTLPGIQAIALIGATTWISVLFFRVDERYGLVTLDGALVLGGLAAALSMTASIG
jgi:hypothetical protein